jgi:hypothetical protein
MHRELTRAAFVDGSSAPLSVTPASPNGARSLRRRRLMPLLLALLSVLIPGLVLEVLYLALYPFISLLQAPNDEVARAVLALFPWLPRLYWTLRWPALWQGALHLPLLATTSVQASAERLLLVLLLLAWLLLLLAAWLAGRAAEGLRSRAATGLLLGLVLLLTALAGLTFLCAPGQLSRDVLLYDFYGRQAVVAHLNPYVVGSSALAHDPLAGVLRTGVSEGGVYGPLWLDITIPLVLLARGELAPVLLTFRLFALCLHLVNTLLIWAILTKINARLRLAGCLLYSWSPLVLLVGVSEAHLTMLMLTLLLLAFYFFQRGAFLLSWVFLFLCTLVQALCLLLLPIFLVLLWRETRTWRQSERWLWWPGLLLITLLISVLAFGPYWQGWGWNGLATYLSAAWWPSEAQASLDAALLHLPVMLPAFWLWVAQPHHWVFLLYGCLALLLPLALWLSDTPVMGLFFGALLLLLVVTLSPVYWPWCLLPPLALALSANSGRLLWLALLLEGGGLLSYYYLAQRPSWPGQALLTVGLPLLIWGWGLFVHATWRLLRSRENRTGPLPAVRPGVSLSRSWPSRPPSSTLSSWPSRWRSRP